MSKSQQKRKEAQKSRPSDPTNELKKALETIREEKKDRQTPEYQEKPK